MSGQPTEFRRGVKSAQASRATEAATARSLADEQTRTLLARRSEDAGAEQPGHIEVQLSSRSASVKRVKGQRHHFVVARVNNHSQPGHTEVELSSRREMSTLQCA